MAGPADMVVGQDGLRASKIAALRAFPLIETVPFPVAPGLVLIAQAPPIAISKSSSNSSSKASFKDDGEVVVQEFPV